MSLFTAVASPAIPEPPTPVLPFLSPNTSSTAQRVSLLGRMVGAGRWLCRLCLGPLLPTKSRRLRVSETVSLGDKRFVSIVEVDGVDYLIGGGAASVALLTPLGQPAVASSFQRAVTDAWGKPETA